MKSKTALSCSFGGARPPSGPGGARTGSARRRARRLRGAAFLGAGLVGALSLAGASGAHAAQATSITLYNGQHVQTTDALVSAFTKATGIKVAVRSEDEGALVNEIETEGARSPADVVFTENSPALESLEDNGLLTRLPKDVLAETPKRDQSAAGDWVGVSARVSVIVYNPKLISKSQLPTTVLGLASARYRNKLALAPGESDFQPIVTAVARKYGTAKALSWLKALKANAGSHIYPDNETITSDVNRGTVAFGVINQYYWYRLGAEIGKSNIHSKITYFAARDPGYVIDVSGAGVLASSKHRAAAERFVSFLVSKKGQEIIAHSQSFEYPLRPGVAANRQERPLSSLKPDPITIGELGDGKLAVSLLQQAGLL